MGCNCKSRKGRNLLEGLNIRDSRWTKKLINETSFMYSEILPKRSKSLEDWGIMFDIHNKIFINSTMTDNLNIKFRQRVNTNLVNFYPEFNKIKKEYEGGE